MNQVLEQNLQALLRQAYHPVRPRAEFRESLLAELRSLLDDADPAPRLAAGARGSTPRPWRRAVAIAAALLLAAPLITLAAIELLRDPGSAPVRDERGGLDPGGVAEVSGSEGGADAASDGDRNGGGRSPLEAVERDVVDPGQAALEGSGAGDSGVLVGRVVDAETGQPVKRFVLWRRPERTLPQVASAIPFEVEDEQGLFRLESVDPDSYALFVEAPEHAVWKLRDALVEAGHESRLEARLVRGAAVHGHVLDVETGAPVPGARVLAEFDLPHGQVELGCRDLQRTPAASTLTDANGAYTLEHLSAGQHQLRVSHPDHAPAWSPTFELSDGVAEAPLELSPISLDTGGRLEGRVERTDGTPWEGVEVITSLIAMERPQPVLAYGFTTTDSDGFYAIERMPEGYYVAMHQGDTPGAQHTVSNLLQTSVRRGATTVLDFVPRTGGTELSGVLTDSNDKPLAGYSVYLNPDPLGAAFENWIATPVRAQGRYRFEGVASGSYELYVAQNADRMIWIRRLEVSGSGELQVDLELPVGSVSGTVRGADGPVTSAMVILMRWDTELSEWAFHGKGDTELDGSYAFAWLGPGRYRLSAIGLSPSRGSANPPPFEVLDEEHQKDLTLVAGGSLTVEVQTETGEPVPGAYVLLQDESGFELPYHAEATTDRAGRQRVPSLAQGTWTVIVVGEGLEEQRETVEVLAGEENSLQVTVRRSSGR